MEAKILDISTDTALRYSIYKAAAENLLESDLICPLVAQASCEMMGFVPDIHFIYNNFRLNQNVLFPELKFMSPEFQLKNEKFIRIGTDPELMMDYSNLGQLQREAYLCRQIILDFCMLMIEENEDVITGVTTDPADEEREIEEIPVS